MTRRTLALPRSLLLRLQRLDCRAFTGPFVRLQHDGGSTGGSGIGLSVVRTLVEKHGGTAWVEDGRTGKGARFVASLPLDLGPAPSLVEVIRAAVTAEHRIPVEETGKN